MCTDEQRRGQGQKTGSKDLEKDAAGPELSQDAPQGPHVYQLVVGQPQNHLQTHRGRPAPIHSSAHHDPNHCPARSKRRPRQTTVRPTRLNHLAQHEDPSPQSRQAASADANPVRPKQPRAPSVHIGAGWSRLRPALGPASAWLCWPPNGGRTRAGGVSKGPKSALNRPWHGEIGGGRRRELGGSACARNGRKKCARFHCGKDEWAVVPSGSLDRTATGHTA